MDSSSARREEHRLPGSAGAVRRVVQCPRCASFEVGLRRTEAGHAFRCDRCEHAWEWAPGHPWPATVVRPARARPTTAVEQT